MICPKCSSEMGDKLVCDTCGFTFRVPETESRNIEAASASSPAPEAAPAPVPAAPTDAAPKPDPSDIPDYDPPRAIPAHTAPRSPRRAAAASYSAPLSPGRYIGLMLLSAIPLVGLILCIIWASSPKHEPNRTNFAMAVLIIKSVLIMFALGAIAMYTFINSPLFIFILK